MIGGKPDFWFKLKREITAGEFQKKKHLLPSFNIIEVENTPAPHQWSQVHVNFGIFDYSYLQDLWASLTFPYLTDLCCVYDMRTFIHSATQLFNFKSPLDSVCF